MPKGYKNGATVAAEVMMSRMSHGGAFLIVEGEDDMRFWRPRRHVECELVNGEGKENVIDGIQRLDASGFAGALGTVDDDYDSLESVEIPSSNVVAVDAHDLECLLCRSSALETVLAEFGDHEKIRRFEREEGLDVRTGLLNRGLTFGRVRWVARRIATVVDSNAIRVPRFVDYGSWTINYDALIREADRRSSDGSALSKQIASLPQVDPWYVARGHDLIEILRIGLMRVLGDLPAATGTAQITSVLRAAISIEEVMATGFGRRISSWERSNHPYVAIAA